MKYIKVTFILKKDLKKRADEYAMAQKITLDNLTNQALEEYLQTKATHLLQIKPRS